MYILNCVMEKKRWIRWITLNDYRIPAVASTFSLTVIRKQFAWDRQQAGFCGRSAVGTCLFQSLIKK